ncbi:neprilysin-2 [Cherax quadricarinatus]
MVHYGLLAVYIYDVLLETVSTADDTDRQSFCLQASKNAFGEVMSNMYLHHVGNNTINNIRTHATSMLELLREEVEESIKSASWLSRTDQAVALGKLHTLEAEMGGFDNHWNIAYVNKSHTEIRFQEDFSFLEAVQELYRVFRRELYRLYHIPIERGAFIWTFTVQPYVVNAFHMQSTNIIVLPEAFFQPPFYRADSPEYLNYGSAANSMAHEIFHGLDFTGVLYDARGHLTRPFSDAVKQHLNQTVQCYHNLLSSNFYEEVLIEDTNIAMEIDSSATLNENLADIAGIRHAYRAYQRWVDRHHTEARLPALSLNPSQLFFVSAAQPYCAVIPDLAKIFLMEMDEHLPNGMRINALMMNTPEFAQAFNCSVDSKMVAQETCHIF